MFPDLNKRSVPVKMKMNSKAIHLEMPMNKLLYFLLQKLYSRDLLLLNRSDRLGGSSRRASSNHAQQGLDKNK